MPGYETEVLENVPLPPLGGWTLTGLEWSLNTDQVLIGAFALSAQRDLGVWRRLLESESIAYWVLMISEQSGIENELRQVFAPSMWQCVVPINSPAGEWDVLRRAEHPDRAFAAVIRAGKARMVMVGPPTEDAWDRFQACAAQPD